MKAVIPLVGLIIAGLIFTGREKRVRAVQRKNAGGGAVMSYLLTFIAGVLFGVFLMVLAFIAKRNDMEG